MTQVFILLIVGMMLTGCATTGKNKALQLIYGKIESKQVVSDLPEKRGILVGGKRGIAHVSSGPAAKASANRNIEKLIEPTQPHYLYTVKKTDGKTLQLVTDKNYLEPSDCVLIEQAEFINLRLVDDERCREQKRNQMVATRHEISARQCALAKNQLAIAQTDRQIATDTAQLEALCQYSR